MKKCDNCKLLKDISLFGKNKSRKDGLHDECKECRKILGKIYYNKNKDIVLNRNKQYRKNNKEITAIRDKNKVLKRKYGITIEDKYSMYEKQEHKCAVCCKLFLEEELCIEHCHITGKIRGLVCRRCNSAMGFMDDNADILQNAANYLRGYNG